MSIRATHYGRVQNNREGGFSVHADMVEHEAVKQCNEEYSEARGKHQDNGRSIWSPDELAHQAAVEAFREVQRAQEPFERPMRLATEALQVIQNWLVHHPEFTNVASELVRIRQEARDARDAVWVAMDGKGKNQAVIDTWDKIAPF